ncbi:hypothetical protein DRN34_00290 [Thermococci archaeon]|nr:MAG: hypothetical protein DRN34_00290 [Thermococci archaeon]
MANNNKAWKPKTVYIYGKKDRMTFNDVVDVFTSKLVQGAVAIVTKKGKLIVTNLPFLAVYERTEKEEEGAEIW